MKYSRNKKQCILIIIYLKNYVKCKIIREDQPIRYRSAVLIGLAQMTSHFYDSSTTREALFAQQPRFKCCEFS